MDISEKIRIGNIAMSATTQITFSDLTKMLGVKTPRAAGQKVKAAWDYYYRNKNQTICDKIASTFVDRNGNFPYENYK